MNRRAAMPHAGMLVVFIIFSACKNDDAAPTSQTTSTDVPAVFAKFSSSVEIYVEGSNVVLKTKDLPNHKSPYWGTGNAMYEAPQAGMVVNPNLIAEQNIVFKIPLNPQVASTITATSLGPIGIAVNGVALFNQYAGPGVPLTNEIQTFDRYDGHPQQFGQYHYHMEPYAITLNDSALVGFMLDGFPVYGKKDMNGTTPTDLDAANGHVGATIDYPNGLYHYHITNTVPYICGGYRGAKGTVTN